MAKSEVIYLAQRKEYLLMESDTLRYNLSQDCTELADSALILERGIRIGQRISALLKSHTGREITRKQNRFSTIVRRVSRLFAS